MVAMDGEQELWKLASRDLLVEVAGAYGAAIDLAAAIVAEEDLVELGVRPLSGAAAAAAAAASTS